MHHYSSLRTGLIANKPNTVMNNNLSCPFCDTEKLKQTNKIIDIDNNIILMENLYPAVDNAYMLVIVENKDCTCNLSNYEELHLKSLFSFCFKHWLPLLNDPNYKSVLFIKNHGLFSGASIVHPHMQLIALKNYNYIDRIEDYFFEGISIFESKDGLVNLSQYPRAETYEFNIIINNANDDSLFFMAKQIQNITHYILNHLNAKVASYNICFYYYKNKYIAKIFSRTTSATHFIGYGLNLVPNNLNDVVNDIVSKYTF